MTLLAAVLLAAQVAAPTASFGGLTPAEETQVAAVVTASRAANTAARELAWSFRPCGFARRPAFIEQARLGVEVTTAAAEALVILVGGNPENMGAPAFVTYPQLPREEQRARAFRALDRAAGKAREAEAHANSVLATTLPAKCSAHWRSMAYLWRVEAAPVFVGIDRQLAYWTPVPRPPPVPGGVATYVAVHGDYVSGQSLMLWGGPFYINRYVTSYLEGITSSTRGLAVLGGPVGAAADARDVAVHAIALGGNVQTREGDPTDDFCRVVFLERLMLGSKRGGVVPGEPSQDHALSFKYHGMQEALAAAAPYMAMRWLQDAMFRLTDAWKHMDWAAWELIRFPNPGRCGAVVIP